MTVAAVIALVLVVVVTTVATMVRVKGPDQARRREPASRAVGRSYAGPADAGAEDMAVPSDGQIGPSG